MERTFLVMIYFWCTDILGSIFDNDSMMHLIILYSGNWGWVCCLAREIVVKAVLRDEIYHAEKDNCAWKIRTFHGVFPCH
jgi:hypothetical protein